MQNPKFRHSVKEAFSFLKSWAKNPRVTGSVVPSTPLIGQCMGENLDRDKEGYIIEIGVGTGTLTQGLLKAGISYKKLVLVEINKNLVKHLHRKFPDLLVIHGDAQELERILPKHIKDNIYAIVSGLPFVSLPKKIGSNILRSIERLLPEEGIFLQFTYRLWKNPLKDSNFEAQRIGRELFNLPPATIWSYRKKKNS